MFQILSIVSLLIVGSPLSFADYSKSCDCYESCAKPKPILKCEGEVKYWPSGGDSLKPLGMKIYFTSENEVVLLYGQRLSDSTVLADLDGWLVKEEASFLSRVFGMDEPTWEYDGYIDQAIEYAEAVVKKESPLEFEAIWKRQIDRLDSLLLVFEARERLVEMWLNRAKPIFYRPLVNDPISFRPGSDGNLSFFELDPNANFLLKGFPSYLKLTTWDTRKQMPRIRFLEELTVFSEGERPSGNWDLAGSLDCVPCKNGDCM